MTKAKRTVRKIVRSELRLCVVCGHTRVWHWLPFRDQRDSDPKVKQHGWQGKRKGLGTKYLEQKGDKLEACY